MKQIISIIRPSKYFELKKKLSEKGFDSMSVSEVTGRGKNLVPMVVYSTGSGKTEQVVNHPMIAKKMIEMFVRDADCNEVVKTIVDTISTGNSGDGKIFVLPVEEARRIRTGEKHDEALV